MLSYRQNSSKRIVPKRQPVLKVQRPGVSPVKHQNPHHTSTQSCLTDRFTASTDSHLADSPYTAYSARTQNTAESATKRPISLTILSKYFADVCSAICLKGTVDGTLKNKAGTMRNVLKDCLTAIHDLSLEVYVLMSSSLKEIEQATEPDHYSRLTSKLVKIASKIEANSYRSDLNTVIIKQEPENTNPEPVGIVKEPEDLSKELTARVSRVTARVLNIWRKIVCPLKEGGIICSAYLLLYSEVDPAIQLSPGVKITYDKAAGMMKTLTANPGQMVNVIRRTKDYIDNRSISAEIFHRIKNVLGRTTTAAVKQVDKTSTAFVLYDMLHYAVLYYEQIMNPLGEPGQTVVEGTNKEPLAESEPILITEPSARSSVLETKLNANRNQSNGLKKVVSQPNLTSKRYRNTTAQKKRAFPAWSPAKKQCDLSARPSITASPIKSAQPSSRFINRRFSQEPVSVPYKQNSKNLQKNGFSAQKYPQNITKSFNSQSSVFRRSSVDVNSEQKETIEEIQYQQFIESKFRSFLAEKMSVLNSEKHGEKRMESEEQAINSKEEWMKEFEGKVGEIRFNTISKLGEDKRFMAELIRAQKELELI
jgi:hypothetical protein